MNLKRGEIYLIKFPHTFDKRYPNGKSKFVLILQEGSQFQSFDTVGILLVTSDSKSLLQEASVKIDIGETILDKTSWVDCTQSYPVLKSLFSQRGVWCAGQLSDDKMLAVDKALYEGFCMKLKLELAKEDKLAENFGKLLVGAAGLGGLFGAAVATAYHKQKARSEADGLVEGVALETE